MNLGIVTLPLHSNYGGNLQNFALQQVLHGLGHESVTLDIPMPQGKKHHERSAEEEADYLERTAAIRSFIEKRIRRTERLSCPIAYERIRELHLDGYVVGSDQVWQPSLSKRAYLDAMFLGFLPADCTARRVVYAASFGPARWTLGRVFMFRFMLGKLARRFDGLSVREEAGAEYCRRYLRRQAEVVLDPVMLMTETSLCEALGLNRRPSGYVMNYILDMTDSKNECKTEISSRLGIFEDICMGSYESTAGIMPSVESWLEGFLNASFVVTDSFHGAVLSILFGKPFVVFGNEKRGIDRFHTLLRPLGLEHRLLTQDNGRYHIPDGVTDLHDLEHAGAVLAELRTRSLGYLQRVLG